MLKNEVKSACVDLGVEVSTMVPRFPITHHKSYPEIFPKESDRNLSDAHICQLLPGELYSTSYEEVLQMMADNKDQVRKTTKSPFRTYDLYPGISVFTDDE